MSYVLDTSAVAALLKGNVLAITRLDLAGKQAVSVPQPVWAELAYHLERSSPSNGRDALRARCRLLRDELARAPWTDAVSEQFGRIKAMQQSRGRSLDDRQVVLAAHAMAAGALLVTHDVELMSCVEGLDVEDWEGDG
jgi:tRNA(fMet)-specific endonuclease VapC